MSWQHTWAHGGELAEQESQETPIELDGEQYLIRSGHLVPYYQPEATDSGQMKRRRERLNIELCNRVFRISDARDVSRRADKADAAIEQLKQAYESGTEEDARGVGRILFGRITAFIRDLSLHYIEHESEDDLSRISDLYSYVMVEHPEIFSCVRLYDHSIDQDGIIEEAFSEIGKTQTQSLESIYAGRAAKIGEAMRGMRQVEKVMAEVIGANPALPLGDVLEGLSRYADAALRLVGFPANDFEAYDPAAAKYVDAFDAVHAAAVRIDHLNVSRGRSHKLAEWLFDGLNLIHSMQNIRDVRTGSIAAYKARSEEWL